MTKRIITSAESLEAEAVLSVKKWQKNLVLLIMIRIS